MRTSTIALTFSLLATAALFVACGSDDDDDSAVTGGTGGTAGAAGSSSGGSGGGSSAVSPTDVCPELVAADCAAMAGLITDVPSCESGLPMIETLCADEMGALLECSGPDPDVSCDANGLPVFDGCEAQWGATWLCVATLTGSGGSGGSAGAGSGGDAGGTAAGGSAGSDPGASGSGGMPAAGAGGAGGA